MTTNQQVYNPQIGDYPVEVIETVDDAGKAALRQVVQAIASFSPPDYDQIDLTYVAAGNGVGKIETVLYKKSSVTLMTLTLSYDSDDRLSSVVKS